MLKISAKLRHQSESDVRHDGVIRWKSFPRYWPFVGKTHWSPVNSSHKGQRRGALMLSLICAWTNEWANNRNARDLRRHCAHYDVTVILTTVAHPQPHDLVLLYHCSDTVTRRLTFSCCQNTGGRSVHSGSPGLSWGIIIAVLCAITKKQQQEKTFLECRWIEEIFATGCTGSCHFDITFSAVRGENFDTLTKSTFQYILKLRHAYFAEIPELLLRNLISPNKFVTHFISLPWITIECLTQKSI